MPRGPAMTHPRRRTLAEADPPIAQPRTRPKVPRRQFVRVTCSSGRYAPVDPFFIPFSFLYTYEKSPKSTQASRTRVSWRDEISRRKRKKRKGSDRGSKGGSVCTEAGIPCDEGGDFITKRPEYKTPGYKAARVGKTARTKPVHRVRDLVDRLANFLSRHHEPPDLNDRRTLIRATLLSSTLLRLLLPYRYHSLATVRPFVLSRKDARRRSRNPGESGPTQRLDHFPSLELQSSRSREKKKRSSRRFI